MTFATRPKSRNLVKSARYDTLFYYNYIVQDLQDFLYLFFILFQRKKDLRSVKQCIEPKFHPYLGNEISIDRLYKSFISDILKDIPISMLSTLMIKQVALVSSPAVKRERQSIKYFLKMKISFFSNCTISNCTFHEVVFNSLTILFSYRKRQFVVNYNYHYNLYSVIITFFFYFYPSNFASQQA